MAAILSVSEVNAQIKALLETSFIQVSIQGEVSNLTYHTSGHVYFSLKDSGSSIRAVLFKGNASRLKFRLENGMDLTLHGALSVYLPRGEYQLIAQSAEPTGVGSLALAYEQLKKELSLLGYFDPALKKALPHFPERVAIITSSTGAALQDMLRVARGRWPLVKFLLLNTLVQGEGAKESIARHIAYADSFGVDVIVVGRGGGSIEDLWAFNERIVAEAIFQAKTPIISAVGHEVDTVISDLVADVRAPTPSAAMEILLPDQNEWLLRLDSQREALGSSWLRVFERKSREIFHLKESLEHLSLSEKFRNQARLVGELARALDVRMHHHLESAEMRLGFCARELLASMGYLMRLRQEELRSLQLRYAEADPRRWCEKGYAQITQEGEVRTLETLGEGERFTLVDGRFKVEAQALAKRNLSQE